MAFSADVLKIDAAREVRRIEETLRLAVHQELRRRGAVVALSGGIDSSVSATLAVRALGKERVVGLLMPERDSAAETLGLSRLIADHLGVETHLEEISGILEAAGCYRRRDACFRQAVPEYGEGWKAKIVLPPVHETGCYRVFSLVALSPSGEVVRKRLPAEAYLGVVAASNFKQRTRKMLEYYYADLHQYAVVGTPNRLEHDQGFFVKNGDGAADVKPIAHLYKTQVYALAEYLGVPAEIRRRPPTTDTYSMPQGQDEFYFSLPYDKMDLCLYGRNHGVAPAEVGAAVGLAAEAVERVYQDIDTKRKTTRYQHLKPTLVEPIRELDLP